jgi:hypothetical protein
MSRITSFRHEVGIWQETNVSPTKTCYIQILMCRRNAHSRCWSKLFASSFTSFTQIHTHQHFADTNFNTIKSIHQPAIGYESVPVSFTCVRHMLLITLPTVSLYSGWRFSTRVYHQSVVGAFLILSIPDIRPVCLNTINLSILTAPPYLQSCDYLHH